MSSFRTAFSSGSGHSPVSSMLVAIDFTKSSTALLPSSTEYHTVSPLPAL